MRLWDLNTELPKHTCKGGLRDDKGLLGLGEDGFVESGGSKGSRIKWDKVIIAICQKHLSGFPSFEAKSK